jgi:AAA domain
MSGFRPFTVWDHYYADLGGVASRNGNGRHATAGPKLRELDTRTLATTEPEPLDWLADGVFCRGKLTLFGGREKRGKSLVQLLLAVKMCSGGGDVAGIPVKPGRVLLVDAENGEREIHRRLRAIGLEPEYADELVIAEARGVDLRHDLDEIAELAAGVDLVLLDSFRALWRGDERDEAEVAAALDPVRDLAHDTDTAVSMTHHAQKGGDEYRGSTAIGASIEWAVMLERVHDDPNKTRRRLVNPLARFAPERPDRWLTVRSEGDDGPVWLDTADAFVREREAPARDEIEAAITAMVREPRSHGVKGDGSVAPSWTFADFARALGRDPKDNTVKRAVRRLAERGELYRNPAGRWAPAPTLFDDDDEGDT